MSTPAEVIARLRELHEKAMDGTWREADDLCDAIITDGPDTYTNLRHYGGRFVGESMARPTRDAVIAEHNAFASLLDVAEKALRVMEHVEYSKLAQDILSRPRKRVPADDQQAATEWLEIWDAAVENMGAALARLAEVGP